MSQLTIPSTLPEDFQLTPPEGLSQEEACRRMEAGLGNKAADDSGRSVGQILRENLITLFNILNVILALCLVLVGSFRNMLFMGVVFSNAFIGTFQELRARKMVKSLTLMTTDRVRTIRDGREIMCLPEELVRGDLIHLSRGSQIPADGVVVSGSGRANESLLTGESREIPKEKDDFLLSGSYLTAGSVTMQLVYVGDESYVSRLTREARKVKVPQSRLMVDLKSLVRRLTFILIPLGILLFCRHYFIRHTNLQVVVPETVAAMVGMIPEGLMLLTSIALTVGVITLGRKGALVQSLYGIETLSRADILCLDKTGTLTTGSMTMTEIMPLEGDEASASALLACYLGAFPESETASTRAMREKIPPAQVTVRTVLPFSSLKKYSAATLSDGSTVVLGAPTFVMPQLSEDLRALIAARSDEGCRVLLLARSPEPILNEQLPGHLFPAAFVILADQVRESAGQTLQYFREQGVQIRLISGDDPRTVAACARRAGLEGWEKYADVSTLSTPEALRDAVESSVIFGRVTPDRKQEIVEILKSQGHHVAMTGDGVNDIPALKAADCSIAMAAGSEAARRSAQLTLVNSDFSVLPDVVHEGRRVVNNITRSASLFLTKTLYSMALSLLLLFIPASYPFQPIQLTLISTLTIGVPSFLLALEANHSRIRGNFLRNILSRAWPGALCVTLCCVLAMLQEHHGWDHEECTTFATLCAGGIGLMNLLVVCWPLNWYRGGVLALMTVGFAGAVFIMPKVFYLTALTGNQIPFLFITLACAAVLMGVFLWIRARIHRDDGTDTIRS